MIFFEPQKFPLYLGNIALGGIALKLGVESISNFSKAFFENTTSEKFSIDARLTHFKKGVALLALSASFGYFLFLFSNLFQPQLSKDEHEIIDADFEVCKNQFQNFTGSNPHLDFKSPPRIDEFCIDYQISLTAYNHFLTQNVSDDKKLEPWIEKISPYFTFKSWEKEAKKRYLDLFNRYLTNCKEAFKKIQKNLVEEIFLGVKFNWPFFCDTFAISNIKACKRYNKLKLDLNLFYHHQNEIDRQFSDLNNYYQASNCGFYKNEINNFVDFEKEVCSKSPFSNKSLCKKN